MLVTDPAYNAQRGVNINTRSMCTDVRRLDGRAVSDRIGEGNAELQGISTTLDEGLDDAIRGFLIRITEGYEGNESTFVFGIKRGKKGIVTGHVSSPPGCKPTRGGFLKCGGCGRRPYRHGRTGRRRWSILYPLLLPYQRA